MGAAGWPSVLYGSLLVWNDSSLLPLTMAKQFWTTAAVASELWKEMHWQSQDKVETGTPTFGLKNVKLFRKYHSFCLKCFRINLNTSISLWAFWERFDSWVETLLCKSYNAPVNAVFKTEPRLTRCLCYSFLLHTSTLTQVHECSSERLFKCQHTTELSKLCITPTSLVTDIHLSTNWNRDWGDNLFVVIQDGHWG